MLATYHRECRSVVLTVAAVEKPAGATGTSGEVVCYLMSWTDRHPLEAVWKGSDAIAIATTDRLEKFDVHDSKDACAGIRVSFAVQFRNEQQATNDPEVLSRLKKALADLGPCINSFYKSAGTSNDQVGHMTQMIEHGEQRSTLELLLGHASDAGCPVAPATYDSLKTLSAALRGIWPGSPPAVNRHGRFHRPDRARAAEEPRNAWTDDSLSLARTLGRR